MGSFVSLFHLLSDTRLIMLSRMLSGMLQADKPTRTIPTGSGELLVSMAL